MLHEIPFPVEAVFVAYIGKDNVELVQKIYY